MPKNISKKNETKLLFYLAEKQKQKDAINAQSGSKKNRKAGTVT